MSKNPHANFTPDLEPYSGVGPFRFWCQMALPLTYDDSLSYYELLCKVVNYINNLISDVSNAEKNIDDLLTAYNELQKYVNDYFDNLDVEEELKNVLDRMAESGELDEILSPIIELQLPGVVEDQIDDVVADQIDDAVADQIDDVVAEQLPTLVAEEIPDEVTDWLNDNVTPVGSAVVVDKSLTISDAAADSKATGDALNDLRNALLNNYNTSSLWEQGKIGEGTGGNGSSSVRIRTITYIENKTVLVECDNDYKFVVYGYASDDTYLGVWTGSAFVISPDPIVWLQTCDLADIETITHNTGLKIRIMAGKADNTAMSVSDSTHVHLWIFDAARKEIEEIEETVRNIDDVALEYEGNCSASADAPLNDIDTVFGVGYYNVRSGSNSPANVPSGYNGGCMLVLPSFTRFLDSGELKNRYPKTQVLIDSTNARIFIRYANSSNVWRAWNKVGTFENDNDIKNVISGKNLIDYTAITRDKRIRVSDGQIVNATNQDISGYIPVVEGGIIELNFALGSDSYGASFYDSDKVYIDSSCVPQSNKNTIFPVPSNAWYMRLTLPKSTVIEGSETATAFIRVLGGPLVRKTKWLAVGDSITAGVYSKENLSTEHNVTIEGWPIKLARVLGYDITVLGSCGMGYTASITGRLPETPNSSTPRISMDDLLTQIETMTDDFNLITIAFGANDYGTISGVTIDTIKTGCLDCLNRITTKFPYARVVCITPFNIYGHKESSSIVPYGTKNDKYAFGTAHGTKTLKQVADAIKECCDVYGVECIYASDEFLLNANNMPSLLLDGTHPSLLGHDLIAKSMAHYLMF